MDLYEQKYNDALERARYYHSKDYMLINSAIENIFPELAESEDERIRKDIISYLRNEKIVKRYISDIEIDKWIAWLEKQGEKTNPYSGMSFEYNGHIWGMCARDNGVDILLDKQLFKHLEKQDEQSTNKIKPKFKVGDWIVGDEGIFKITRYEDEYGYELTGTTGYVAHFISSDYVESNFNLWTIQDAKDGDVLCYENKNDFKIFIYKNGHIHYHCCYSNGYLTPVDSFFVLQKHLLCYIQPATKEQRELLFSKMKQAGYEWDTYKKELTSKESEDERIKKELIRIFKGETRYTSKEDADKYIAWLEKQGKQKQIWKPNAAQLIVIKDLIEDKNTSKVNKVILRGMFDKFKQFTNTNKREIDDAYLQGICDAKHEIEKQGEQPTSEHSSSDGADFTP